jgi:hypothetical protein
LRKRIGGRDAEFRQRQLAVCASTVSTIINWLKRVGFL